MKLPYTRFGMFYRPVIPVVLVNRAEALGLKLTNDFYNKAIEITPTSKQ